MAAAARARDRRRFLSGTGGALALLAALWLAAQVSDFNGPALLAGIPHAGDYFERLLPPLRWSALLSGSETEGALAWWFYRLDTWLWLLFETSQMALLATALGAALAFALCFPAAANLAPNRLVYGAVRRTLELCRTVPEIVYALILVWAYGIGPLAGILAITIHTVGALGKLFAEAVENIDMRPWESVRASGGTWTQAVRYAALPQVAPDLLSYLLLRFEINVRGATVIGFVGAGGIGEELRTAISLNYYEDISAIVILIALAVTALDIASERLRARLIGAVA